MARKRTTKRGHGMGCVYQRGAGNWWIKWREGGKVRYKGSFVTKEIATELLAQVVNNIERGEVGVPEKAPEVPMAATLAELAKDWLERRKVTNRSAGTDAGRWKNHLAPAFGKLQPDQVDAAGIRRFVEDKRAAGLNTATIGHCVRLLSTFYTDLLERKLARENPVRTLPRSLRKLYRPTTDPKQTPFLDKLDDVRRVYLALASPFSVIFAIGAFGMLRPGEVLGLDWRDVDLDARRINVHQQVVNGRLGPLKDDDSRRVPIQTSLLPILAAYKLKTGGEGLLFRPAHPTRGGRLGSPPQFVRSHTMHQHLRKALAACKIPRVAAPTKAKPDATRALTLYECTRHSGASHWVLQGGSIEKLAEVMGHSSVIVTHRYAHMRPELFQDADHALLNVDMAPRRGDVVSIAAGRKDASSTS